MNREILCRRLERKGYDVTTAENGVRALELVGEQIFDLMLLDIMMPVVSGLDVLKTVRERFDPVELPVIMVTAKTGTEDIVAAFELGASDYVTKPIDFPVAFARVRTQLQLRFAEVALKESEERYALAAQGSNDGLWDIDLRSQVAYYSARWAEILGIAEGALEPNLDAWFSRVHPEDVGRLRDDFQGHLLGHAVHFQNEHRIRHRDGDYRWVLSRGAAIRDEAGQAVRAAGSMTDITARRQIQEQLQQELISDSLTGLANQKLLFDRIESAIVRSQTPATPLWMVVLLELDDLSRTIEA
ncbi:MAG: response regulator, partial [Myxococcales bacterium]|nr:response regulator [Myxococcales bacterium]